MALLLYATYAVVIIFVIVMISRVLRIMRMPVHLRWELYPVPHEKGRAHYGGSKLEELDWWTKDHPKDHFNELKEMGTEILGLKAVWEYNRSLWTGTFPFHFGLYMMIGNMFLLIISGILMISGQEISGTSCSGCVSVLYYAIYYIGLIAAIMGTFGSLRLLFSRIVDQGLRLHSSISHFFNIILIGGMFASLLIWILLDGNFVANATLYYSGLLSFGGTFELPTIAYWHIGICLFFVLYLPFTHMTHMVLKYFSYHSVRWEDEPNVAGSKMNETLGKQLGYKVSWSAKHIGSEGKKNWGEVVSDLPEDM